MRHTLFHTLFFDSFFFTQTHIDTCVNVLCACLFEIGRIKICAWWWLEQNNALHARPPFSMITVCLCVCVCVCVYMRVSLFIKIYIHLCTQIKDALSKRIVTIFQYTIWFPIRWFSSPDKYLNWNYDCSVNIKTKEQKKRK